MRHLWVLAWKEVRLAFRDVGAIVTMLVTPLVLTLVIGAAFSGSGDVPLSNIPVLLLNRDEGVFSGQLVDFFNVEGVDTLISLEMANDEVAARARVESDEVAALVIIPSDFSSRVLPLAPLVQQQVGLDLLSLRPGDELTPAQTAGIADAFRQTQQQSSAPTVIEIYASPNWRLSANVLKSVIQQGIEALNMQVQGINVVVGRLFSRPSASGAEGFDATQMLGAQSDFQTGAGAASTLPIDVEIVSSSGTSFSWISYSAASMSVLFLMFAVTSGGRTLLAERAAGTLPRLLVAPIPALTVLLGKMAGVGLTGLLQMVVLWGATSLIGAYWGPPTAALASILILVIAASGVGAMISAWSRTQGQAGAIGTAVTLVGSAMSGTFFPRSGLPGWVQTVSLVTPNAWGIEIFSRLQGGQGLADVLPLLGGVVAIAVVYYGVALVGFRRQFE